MRDTRDLNLVRKILEAAGLGVEKIAEGPDPTCDFQAEDESQQYLIEVKSFHDDQAIGPALRENGLHSGERCLHFSHTMRDAIEEANKQLRATQGTSSDRLRIVALIARSRYGRDVTERRILGTLYGTRCIVHPGTSKTMASTDCLYFSHSAFHRHPDMDGAIVCNEGGSLMCLNDFGSDIQRVRDSALGRWFGTRGVLHDASTLEREGNVFVADCQHDRGQEDEVLRYIQQKYHLGFAFATNPIESSAMSVVSDRDPNRR